LADKARQLRDEYQKQIHNVLAPDIFPGEVAHGLTRAERRSIIQVGHAAGFLADILQTSPVLLPYLPLLSRAVEISSQFRIGVFDCLYVALAERESCDLVTADTRLINNLQGHFPFIKDISSLP
jgi:predicted nucleic acid-binding protein